MRVPRMLSPVRMIDVYESLLKFEEDTVPRSFPLKNGHSEENLGIIPSLKSRNNRGIIS